MWKIFRLIKQIGIVGAVLYIFFRLTKPKHSFKLISKFSLYPLWCRPNTSDMDVFREVFIKREFSFLDDDYNSLYANEEQTRKLFTIFTLLAVFIACLGLFGLVSFSAQRRTREIGIRRVLGASSPRLTFLLVREFLKWVLIANLLAWPVALYLMNRWLQNFAYRTDISMMSFVVAALLAFLIALLTVIYQAIRASSVIPVRALRYE